MAYTVRTPGPCRGCGQLTTSKVKRGRDFQCLDCGLKAAIAAARSLRERSGPNYEKWRANGGERGRPRRDEGGR